MPDLHMFDYPFLQGPIPQSAARLLEENGRLKDRLLACRQAHPGIYGALERAGRVQSLLAACGAGNMEGRAAEICARNSPPINEVERAMADYRDALFEVQMGHPPLEPCRRDLLRLHKQVLARTCPGAAGHYREEGGPFPADRVAEAMEDWERAAEKVCAGEAGPMLLAAPCLVADFICTAPFAPGGRRMAYLITRLLLQKAGAVVPGSWEEQAARTRIFFADALQRRREGGSYWPFIECFLAALYLCGCRAEKAFALLPGRKMTKKSRVEAAVARSPVPISKGEICRLLPDVSPTTVEAALGELVRGGAVVRRGSARTARYTMA